MVRERRSLLIFALAATLCRGAWAQDAPVYQLYRYVDDRGVTVLDRQGVPSEYISKGYQVLNQQGRVVRIVPPALSADELKAAATRKAQADADAQLLGLYSSLDELDSARNRKLAELDGMIAIANNNIKSLEAQLASLQGQAASQQRSGRAVPQSLVQQINAVRDQRTDQNAQVARYQRMKDTVSQGFAKDRSRLDALLHPK